MHPCSPKLLYCLLLCNPRPHTLTPHHLHVIRPQVVVVTDPDLYQPLLRPGAAKLPKYTAPYRMFEVFTNPERSNVLTSRENATWKAVRQAAVVSLSMNNLRWAYTVGPGGTRAMMGSLSSYFSGSPCRNWYKWAMHAPIQTRGK